MHLKRLIVAVILVPIFYFYVMLLPSEYFLFLLSFITVVGLGEFYAMFKVEGMLKYIGIFWGVVLLTVFFLAKQLYTDALLLCVLTMMGMRLFLRRDPTSSCSDVSTAVLGLLYIPGLLMCQLSVAKAGPEWIILLYTSVWAADSMAYYVGKSIGRRKLYEEVSPNKTVAGAVGSLLGGIIGAAVINAVLLHRISIYHMVIIGTAVGAATIVGDLVESMFKRDAGVKDSSWIIPGHGGVLDKIDGVTFAGPVFYWLCSGIGLFK
jgi:phosphatidate cytidylyltransferase